jgi:hypothetical protein
MNTKHKPATPLPEPDGVSANKETLRRADAYPKLVEQLQALADSHAKLELERGSQRATHTANARALLRELGEGS